MSNTPKKSTTSGDGKKYIDIDIMRNIDGSISKVAIDKLASKYREAGKVKGNREKFIKENRATLRRNGIGVRVKKKSIQFYDLFTNKGGSKYVRDMNKMTGIFSENREQVLSNLRKRRNLDKKLKKNISTGNVKLAKPDSSRRTRMANGVKTSLIYRIKDMGGTDVLDNIRLNLERVIKYAKLRYPDLAWNVYLSREANPFNDRYNIAAGKVGYKSGDLAVEEMIEKLEDRYANYDDDDDRSVGEIRTIGISFYIYPNSISGAGGHKTIQQANKIWFICDSYAKTNCFWRCVAFQNILKEIENGKLPEDYLDDNNSANLHRKITHNSKAMKNRCVAKDHTITRRLTTELDIQKWLDFSAGATKTGKCKRCYHKVVIWNEVYKKVRTLTPTGIDESKCESVYEIWAYNGHFVPMIRWYNLINIRELCEQKLEDMIVRREKELTQNTMIEARCKWEIEDKEKYLDFFKEQMNIMDLDMPTYENGTKFINKTLKSKMEKRYIRLALNNKWGNIIRAIDPIDNRIAAYDFEATANGTDENEFKVFRTSMSYNEVDDENRIIQRETNAAATKTFGGEKSVESWLKYLSDNIGYFHDYTFYAHNGGKFDLLLILNEYILENDTDWTISPDFLIVLNGAYLNMILVHRESTPDNPITITFKDSLKLLPAGLGKLTEEFNVPHKKIGEVVNHDDVNLSNCFGGKVENVNPKTFFSSMAFKIEMSQKVYCNYDCIGLLEMLNSFNNTIWERCGFSITGCITGATLSKNNYLNKYYSEDTPIYNMCDEFDEICRAGYYGGRNESLYIGRKLGKLYYFDFTSLYPDVARYRVPYGRPYLLTENGINILNEKRAGYTLREGTAQEKVYPPRSWSEIFTTTFPLGMIRVRMKTKPDKYNELPLHAIKRDGKLLFPVYENWTENTVWTSELIYGAELDIYDYEILGGVCFAADRPYGSYELSTFANGELDGHTKYASELYRKKNNEDMEDFFQSPNGILCDFFEDAFNGKAAAKKAGKEALAFAEKIIANSGYGFWGINVNGKDGDGRDGLEILHDDDETLWNLIKREEVVNVNKKGKYNIIRTKKKLEVKNFNVAIAAAICSEARMKLYRLLKMVKESGGNVYYMDTDSCIIDIPLTPEMIRIFDWDDKKKCRAYGEPLGSLKNECDEKIEKYFKKRIDKGDFKMEYKSPDGRQLFRAYNKAEAKAKVKELVKMEIDNDNGELCFDKGIFGGCKQYCLHKTLKYVEPNGKHGEVIASAFKGCKKDLDYEDYEHLLFGTKLEEQIKIEKEIKAEKLRFDSFDKWVMPHTINSYRLWEKQSQFRTSIIDHIGINKTGAYTPIQRVDVDKSFRINYLKGTIEGATILDGIDGSGFITPIRL
jgi:hypothetical protein